MREVVKGYVLVVNNWEDHLSGPHTVVSPGRSPSQEKHLEGTALVDAVSWDVTKESGACFVHLFTEYDEAEQDRLKLKDPDKWKVMALRGELFEAMPPSRGPQS